MLYQEKSGNPEKGLEEAEKKSLRRSSVQLVLIFRRWTFIFISSCCPAFR
jgi:hypothetical protein